MNLGHLARLQMIPPERGGLQVRLSLGSARFGALSAWSGIYAPEGQNRPLIRCEFLLATAGAIVFPEQIQMHRAEDRSTTASLWVGDTASPKLRPRNRRPGKDAMTTETGQIEDGLSFGPFHLIASKGSLLM